MLFIRLLKRIREKRLLDLSAQVGFYLILAFFPFIMLLLNIISYTPLASPEILEEMAWILPENTFGLVISVVEELAIQGNLTLLSFSVMISLLIASRGMLSLERAINVSYEITSERPFGLQVVLSVALTFILLVTINVAFVGLVLGQIIGNFLVDYTEFSDDFLLLWNAIRYLISLLFLMGILTILYLGLPNRKLSFREVWPGAVFTTAGWIIVSLIFTFYVNNIAIYSYIYGSLGAVVALLLWLYLCSLVFLAGGELNALFYEKNRDSNEPGM